MIGQHAELMPSVKTRVPFVNLKRAVCEHFCLSFNLISSPSRLQAISRPRQILAWLARKYTKLSFLDIGARLGGRDHTTIMYAVKEIDRMIIDDPIIAKHVAAIEVML
jgi:chromosomal replication initiator protein